MIKELLRERKLPEIPKDRNEILEVLQREEYGFLPPKPDEWHVEEIETIDERFPCGASEKRMRMTVKTGDREFSFPFITALHTDGKKRPFFIHDNFRSAAPDLYMPTEEILDNGFDILSFCYKDVTSDDNDFTNGIADIFVGAGERRPTQCGKIIMWAWAAMRIMDYAETLPGLDLNNGAIIGHSRLGKTALVTAMLDTRFKFAFSNNSGCSGDAITRGKIGEQVSDITKNFPFWFCPNYFKYAGKHDEMPFDQHFLVASIAPRYAYAGASLDDKWADPDSQYLNCAAASEYYENLGVDGFICDDRLPAPGDFYHDGHIGYHLRSGMHFLSRRDWQMFMEFFKKHID